MLGIPLGLLIRIGAAIALAIAAAWLWHAFTGHYKDIGRAEVQAKWDADKAARNKAIADQALAWDAQRLKTEKAENERDAARTALFAALQPLPPDVARQHVPAAFVGVLRDNAHAANAAGTAAQPDKAAAPTATGADPASAGESDLGLIAEWFREVALIHAECRDRVSAWISFYRGLQSAQPKGATP